MRIPGRARCNCFYDKKIHYMKTGKFNRDEYTQFRDEVYEKGRLIIKKFG